MHTVTQQLPWYRYLWVWVIISIPLVVILFCSGIMIYLINNPLPEAVKEAPADWQRDVS